MTTLNIYRAQGSIVGGDLKEVTLKETGEFHELQERTRLVSTPVWDKDGVEWCGPHEWDPDGTIEAQTGKPMQRPRMWPPTAPVDMFIEEFTRYTPGDDEVERVED